MSQNTYPFRVCDVNTNMIYVFLVSVYDRSFACIRSAIHTVEMLPQHNSGYGSFETCPDHLCPHGLLAYMCGSQLDNKDFRLYLERKWKVHRDSLIARRNRDPQFWARNAEYSAVNKATQEKRQTLLCCSQKLQTLLYNMLFNFYYVQCT